MADLEASTPALLTPEQAFDAMSLFIYQFAGRAGDDLLTLMGDISIDDRGRTFDPAAWDDWLECVRQVLAYPGRMPSRGWQ
ncbi:hypothetical protein [Thalassiella azotivora]